MHNFWLTSAYELWRNIIEAKRAASPGKGTFTFTYHYMGDDVKCTFIPLL